MQCVAQFKLATKRPTGRAHLGANKPASAKVHTKQGEPFGVSSLPGVSLRVSVSANVYVSVCVCRIHKESETVRLGWAGWLWNGPGLVLWGVKLKYKEGAARVS